MSGRSLAAKLALRFTLPALALASAAACAQVLGFKEFTKAAPDAGSGLILYVNGRQGNPQADAERDGRTPNTAFATIKSAVSRRASDPSLLAYEIHVCGGEYSEGGLEISSETVLRGGYDCSSWKRADDFGYPLFSTRSESKLMPPPMLGPTLTVRGVSRTTLIEGFTVVGASGRSVGIVAEETSAVFFSDGAAATFAQSMVLGGRLVGTAMVRDAGSIAIASDKAHPRLERVLAVGGSAASDAKVSIQGSAGLVIAGDSSEAIEVDSCTIRGSAKDAPKEKDGGASGALPQLGAGGIVVGDGAALLVKESVVEGGIADGAIIATAGLFAIDNSHVRIERSTIDGGSGGLCSPRGALCTRVGVWVATGSDLILRDSFVHGGSVVPDGETIGLYALKGRVFAANNTIHGGGRLTEMSVGLASTAVRIGEGARAFAESPTRESGLYANTLIVGLARDQSPTSAAINFRAGSASERGWAFVGNLIVGNNYQGFPDAGHNVRRTWGIITDDCQDPNLRFQYNALLDVKNTWGSVTCNTATVASKELEELETSEAITGDGGVSKRRDNVRYAASCPIVDAGDPGSRCTPCGDTSCSKQLIANFSETLGDFDIAPGFFAPTQKPPISSSFCPLFGAGGGLEPAGGGEAGAFVVSKDKEGKARTAPLTPGAFEVDCP